MAEAIAQKLVPPFRQGTKQVFLCNQVVTFLRTPRLPPQFASFRVPLNFTKLDIRDYLWNLYGVGSLKVRSRVQGEALRPKPFARRVYRPRSKKYMTVELAEPFVWPELPLNLEDWSHDLFNARHTRWAIENKKQHMVATGETTSKSVSQATHSARSVRAGRLRAGILKWSTDVLPSADLAATVDKARGDTESTL